MVKRATERRKKEARGVRGRARKPSDDPLLELSGDLQSLPADLSAAFDRHLVKTFETELLVTRPRGS
jgi:hypothetical protein